MLSYRRKTPPTVILDTPVIAGVAAAALVLAILSFLVGRWSAGGPEQQPAPETMTGSKSETAPPPIQVQQSGVEGDLSFLDRVERDRKEEASSGRSAPRVRDQRPATEEEMAAMRNETSRAEDGFAAAASTRQPLKPEPPAESRPSTAVTPPPPADSSGYLIQVYASEQESKARELSRNLVSKGYPTKVTTAVVKGKTYFRVRVGPYNSKSKASDVARRLESEEKLKTWISKS